MGSGRTLAAERGRFMAGSGYFGGFFAKNAAIFMRILCETVCLRRVGVTLLVEGRGNL
jgi:hypothetical protein